MNEAQKEFLAKVSELLALQEKQHQEHIARRDDEELSFFAAHAMGALISRDGFGSKHLAETAFEYAQEMMDHKNKLTEPPKSRIWQCRCGIKNLDRKNCGNCGSLRNDG